MYRLWYFILFLCSKSIKPLCITLKVVLLRSLASGCLDYRVKFNIKFMSRRSRQLVTETDVLRKVRENWSPKLVISKVGDTFKDRIVCSTMAFFKEHRHFSMSVLAFACSVLPDQNRSMKYRRENAAESTHISGTPS